jgi:hypothetical protein
MIVGTVTFHPMMKEKGHPDRADWRRQHLWVCTVSEPASSTYRYCTSSQEGGKLQVGDKREGEEQRNEEHKRMMMSVCLLLLNS